MDKNYKKILFFCAAPFSIWRMPFLCIFITLFAVTGCSSHSEDEIVPSPYKQKKGVIRTNQYPKSSELYNLQVPLPGGSELDIYYQIEARRDLAMNTANMLRDFHKNIAALFNPLPNFSTTIVLVDRDLFYVKTSSPRWVHALYHKGRIFIPIDVDERIDYVQLYRSLKHEYTHSVINTLTSGKCPGWIDEGLAQWFEGIDRNSEHFVLSDWLKSHNPIPLHRLQKGFATMDQMRAKVSYAQSLFAIHDLINTYGISKFRIFFDILKNSKRPERAFSKAFGISEKAYEQILKTKLIRWSKSRKRNFI